MGGAESQVFRKAAAGLVQLLVTMGLCVFFPAGTVRFVGGWIFLAVFFSASAAITVYLAMKDPELLARRTQGGPAGETERSQKIIMGFASLSFLAVLVIPALDHRFGWSHVPIPLALSGEALVALGFLIVFLVFRENTFTSAVIEVAAEQHVIDTGPYALVRHPMYVGGLVLVAGVPLALGSLVGLVTLPPFVAILAWRLLDEERFLARQLPGYEAYRKKTRYRLVPGIW